MAELLFDRYTVKQMMDATGLSRDAIYDRIHSGKYKVTRERGGRGWYVLIPRGQDPAIETENIGRIFAEV